MYWEESIEFINNHSIDTTIPGSGSYGYVDGTLRTNFAEKEKTPDKLNELFKGYINQWDGYDIQLFSSLGASKSIENHTDPDNLIIVCIEGSMKYIINGKTYKLKTNESIFIPKGTYHEPLAKEPRICISIGTPQNKPKNVTYIIENS